jgi:hypothetical protein
MITMALCLISAIAVLFTFGMMICKLFDLLAGRTITTEHDHKSRASKLDHNTTDSKK